MGEVRVQIQRMLFGEENGSNTLCLFIPIDGGLQHSGYKVRMLHELRSCQLRTWGSSVTFSDLRLSWQHGCYDKHMLRNWVISRQEQTGVKGKLPLSTNKDGMNCTVKQLKLTYATLVPMGL
jgi:hypothetical protein